MADALLGGANSFDKESKGCCDGHIRIPLFPFLWIHSIWKSETSSSLGIYFSRFHRISISLSIFPIKGFLVNTA